MSRHRWLISARKVMSRAKRLLPGRFSCDLKHSAAIREGNVVKGNVLATARVAATLSVKNTPDLIPMCHSIPISAVAIDFEEGDGFIEATVRVKTTREDRCGDGSARRGFDCIAYGLGYGEIGRERCAGSVSGNLYSGYPGH